MTEGLSLHNFPYPHYPSANPPTSRPLVGEAFRLPRGKTSRIPVGSRRNHSISRLLVGALIEHPQSLPLHKGGGTADAVPEGLSFPSTAPPAFP